MRGPLPRIVSVDDHVVEPAHVWQTWLPERFRERGPRVERRVTFETDYPHTDSTWPDTKTIAEGFMAGVDDETIFKIMRGNALRMLDRPQDWTAS